MRFPVLFIAVAVGQGWSNEMPYGLSLARDLPLVAGLSIMKYHSGSLLAETREDNRWNPGLRKGSIPLYDRWVVGNYSPALSSLSSVVAGAELILPIGANLIDTYYEPSAWNGMVVDAVVLQEALVLSGALSSYAKSARVHSTPIAYDESVPESEKRAPQNASSFFSNHTASAFTTAVYSAYTYQLRHPDSPLVPWAWGGSLAMASGVGAMRIMAGKHFLSDVVAGAVAGAMCGYLLPRLHMRGPSREHTVSGDGKVPQAPLDWELGVSFFGDALAAGPELTLRF